MSIHQSINATPRVPWLVGKARNIYTQFGEDGLIEAVFQRIGETNRQCFECGAADGLFFSNTLALREQGWRAVLIESNEVEASKLIARFGRESVCLSMHCTGIDGPMTGAGMSAAMDLGVIDVDGQDYWLWHDMEKIRPRVMLVEIHPHNEFEPIPERGAPYPHQAGLHHIEALGNAKGYQLVATTHCNALFVDWKCL